MNELRLTANTADRALLSGPLHVHSIHAVQEQGVQLIAQAPQLWVVDMAEVTQVSSAGVALLLHWLRAARKHNKGFYIEHLPDAMRPILQISDLNPLFAPLLRHGA